MPQLNLASILAFLAPFEVLLKPELLSLEESGNAELKKIMDQVQSPDLKALLVALDAGLDAFAKLEIGKLG